MPDIDGLARRPAAYLLGTGLPQFTAGLAFFLIGAPRLVVRFLPKTDLAQEVPGWLAICGIAAVLWGAKMLKERVVFPRGGYVEVLRHEWSLSAILALALSIFIISISQYIPGLGGRLMAPGFAILFAVWTLADGWRNKSSLMSCFGVYLLCLAAVLWALPIARLEQDALLEVGAGAPLAIGGGFILRRFLKANPKRLEARHG